MRDKEHETSATVIDIEALSYSHITLYRLTYLLLFCNLWFNYEY